MKTIALRIREDDMELLQSMYPNSGEKFADYFHEVMKKHFVNDDKSVPPASAACTSYIPPETEKQLFDMLHDILSVASENNDRLFGRNGVAMYGDAKKVKSPVEFVFAENGYMEKPHYIGKEEMQYLRVHPKDLDRTCSYLQNYMGLSDEDTEMFRDMCNSISLEVDEDW